MLKYRPRENRFGHKLTTDDIEAIRISKDTNVALSKRYHVSATTIGLIKNEKRRKNSIAHHRAYYKRNSVAINKRNIESHRAKPAAHRLSVKNAQYKSRMKAMKILGNRCELRDASCKGILYFHHRLCNGQLDPIRKKGSHAMAINIRTMENPKSKYQLLCQSHDIRAEIASGKKIGYFKGSL